MWGADAAELYTSNNFALTIDFTNRRIDSTTEVSLDTNTATLVASGGFNELGVIFGTTELTLMGANTDSGPLTGLIGGQASDGIKSALGVFHSGTTPAERAFAGGFVASDKICSDNPFDLRCAGDEESVSARKLACADTANPKQKTECTAICDVNSFLPECVALAFDDVRTKACLLDGSADIASDPNRCVGLIDRHCRTVNPFDTRGGCNSNTAYNNERKVACEMDSSNNPCTDTIARVCPDDPFNAALCYMGDTYEVARVNMCLDSSIPNANKDPSCEADNDPSKDGNDGVVERYCEKPTSNADTNPLCMTTILRECDLNNDPFHGLCTNNRYVELRTTACLVGRIDTNPPGTGSRCPNLISIRCTANPFDATRPPGAAVGTGQCEAMDYNDERLEFVKECEETPITVTGCDTTIVAGTTSVEDCIGNPFLDACSNMDSTIRTEFRAVVKKECIADAGNTANRLFSPLCLEGAVYDADDTLKMARDDYCTNENVFKSNCTPRDEIESKRETVVTDCIDNGVDHPTCNQDAKVSDAVDALTLRACIDDPYQTGCDADDFVSAISLRTATITKCRESENLNTARECRITLITGRTIAQCVLDPFNPLCTDEQGFMAEKEARNILCRAEATYFDRLCDGYTDAATTVHIDTTRTNFVTMCMESDPPADCAAFVNACLLDPYSKGAADALLCDYPAFADVRLTHCGKDNNVKTVMECEDLDTINKGCITNPFVSMNCVDEAKYGGLRTARVTYCTSLGSETAAANPFCEQAISDTCSDTYIAIDDNTDSNPFDELCGVAYDDARITLCRGGNEEPATCADTIAVVCKDGRMAVGEVEKITANPFDTLCNAKTYKTEREELVADCNSELIAPTDSRCNFADTEDDALSAICVARGEFAAPFAKICNNLELAVLVEYQRVYCLATGRISSACDQVVNDTNVVDSNLWQRKAVVNDNGTPNDLDDDEKLTILTIASADSTEDELSEGDPTKNYLPPPPALSSDNPTANFLRREATVEELKAAGFGDTESGDPFYYTANTLNLFQEYTNADGQTINLGGAETDRVFVISTGDTDDANGARLNKLYAGLSPDANLGGRLARPDEGAATTAIWYGRTFVHSFVNTVGGVGDPRVYSSNDFALMVDFADRTIDSTTEVSYNANKASLVIDGEFNRLGVIFGTVSLTLMGDTKDSGLLTGLIGVKSQADGGVKSALGAFHSGTTAADRAFAGGFVASNKFCTDNPFDDLCEDDRDSDIAREEVCVNPTRDGIVDKCAPTLERLCTTRSAHDPFERAQGAFDYDCLADPTFNPQRETHCTGVQMRNIGDPISGRCVEVVKRVCMANPFDERLCYYTNDNEYIDDRGLACLKDKREGKEQRSGCVDNGMDVAIMLYCATEDGGMDNLCTNPTRLDTCVADPFEASCLVGNDFAALRDIRCLASSMVQSDDTANTGGSDVNGLCPDLIKTYCDNNPFVDNPHCSANIKIYNDARRAFVNDCYDPANTDTSCDDIKSCLTDTTLFSSTASFGDRTCNSMNFDGARARFCSQGDNIETSEHCTATATANRANNPCIENPYGDFNDTTTCAEALGSGVTETHANRADYCFQGGNAVKPVCAGALNGGVKGIGAAQTPGNCLVEHLFSGNICDNHEAQRAQRVAYCLGDSPDLTICDDGVRAGAICNHASNFADPFAPLCDDTMPASDYTEADKTAVRKAVALHCKSRSSGSWDANLMASCEKIATCTADPYTDSVLCKDNGFDDSRVARRGECIGTDAEPTAVCSQLAVEEICATSPVIFAWLCQQPESPSFVKNAAFRQRDCLTNPGAHTQCDKFVLEGGASHNLWKDKALKHDGTELVLFATDLELESAFSEAPFNETPNTADRTPDYKTFERILNNASSTNRALFSYNLSDPVRASDSEPEPEPFKNSAGHTIILGGDASDGFRTYHNPTGAIPKTRNVQNYHYPSAGILTGTHLGALFVKPEDGSAPTATWYGRVGAVINPIKPRVAVDGPTGAVSHSPTGFAEQADTNKRAWYSSNDFKLTIDFNAQTLDSLTTFATDRTLTLVDVRFNKFGIIYGQVTFSGVNIAKADDTVTATLTGLIGSEGAVATWAISTIGHTGYVGKVRELELERTGISFTGGFVASSKTCENPFRSACGAEHEAERVALVESCPSEADPDAPPNIGCDGVRACKAAPFTNDSNFVCSEELFAEDRVIVCVDNVNNPSFDEPSCGALVVSFCNDELNKENLFKTGCKGNPIYDLARANACGESFSVSPTTCETTINDFCIDTGSDAGTRPFEDVCKNRGYGTQRATVCLATPTAHGDCVGLLGSRVTNCAKIADDTVRNAHPLCGEVNPCIDDPFANTDFCRFVAFDGLKTTRRLECLDDAPADATSADCMSAKTHLCKGRDEYAATFALICSEEPDIALEQRIYCYRGNSAEAECTEINNKTFAKAEVWQYSAVDTDGETFLNILSAQDIDNATDRANFVVDDGSISVGSAVNTVTLANTKNGAFFATRNVSGQDISYAGILESTDLGAPLTPSTPQGTWTGKISLQVFATGEIYKNDNFQLNVRFAQVGNRFGVISSADTRLTPVSTNTAGDIVFTVVSAGRSFFNKFGVIYGVTNLRRVVGGETSHYEGLLTGLIGIKGAVGAFIPDGTDEDEDGYIGVFAVAQPDKCLIDPFTIGEDCLDAQKIAKIAECSTEDNINNAVLCGDTLDANPCLIDPFNTLAGCDVKTEFEFNTVRENRWTFCLEAGNATNPLCEPVAYLCSIDGTAPDTRCDEIIADNKAIVAVFCAGSANADTAPCGVNAERWVEHAYSVDDNATPVITTDDVTTRTDIVETIADGSPKTGFINLPKVDFTKAEDGAESGAAQLAALKAAAATPIDVTDMDLNLLTLGNHKLEDDTAVIDDDPALNLLGDEEDGAFYVNGNNNGQDAFYAGITATTDLGAPLEMPTTATWHGRIRFFTDIYERTVFGSDDFQLMIDFTGDVGTLTSVTTVTNGTQTGMVTITGKFDRFGLVYGTTTVSIGGVHSGLITGLIGEEGAVGAFVSESTSSLVYAGAFVANDEICALNPFNFRCRAEFHTARVEIVNKCKGDAIEPADETACAAAKPFICVATPDYDSQFIGFENYAHPFAALCNEGVAKIDEIRRELCLGNPSRDQEAGRDCGEVVTAGGVKTDIWTTRAENDDGDRLTIRDTIAQVTDSTNPEENTKTEFWVADKTEAQLNAMSGLLNTLEINEITLAKSDDGVNLGGEATNGARAFQAVWRDNSTDTYFAGILPTTNLGARLVTPYRSGCGNNRHLAWVCGA